MDSACPRSSGHAHGWPEFDINQTLHHLLVLFEEIMGATTLLGPAGEQRGLAALLAQPEVLALVLALGRAED